MREEVLMPNAEDIRTEYSALSTYFNTVIQFRFTTLGFYLAAVGLLIGSSPLSKDKAFLILGLSIALWCLELRNRTLFYDLANRAIQIEREYWNYRGRRAYDPFFSHMMKLKPSDEPEAPPPPPYSYPKVWNWIVKIPMSHTKALDLIYLVVAVYALYRVFTL